MNQMLLPLNDARLTAHELRRIDVISALTGLPLRWDRSHPAYLRYGLGPLLDLPRYILYSLRAEDRWD